MKVKIATLGAVLLALFVGGLATAWFASAGPFAKSDPEAVKIAQKIDGQATTATADSRFVTLDKLIVMLRAPEATRSRYLALDLVFQTDAKQEKQVKDQLPLLRSAAYRALSGYSMDDIRAMDVDQLSAVLQDAYTKVYGGAAAVPFSNVQVGKQMLE